MSEPVLVPFEMIGACTFVVALIATEELLSTVGLHVSLKVGSSRTFVVALFAEKILFATVSEHLHLKTVVP